MENSNIQLSGKDIVQIINAASKAGAIRLRVGEFEVTFTESEVEDVVLESIAIPQLVRQNPPQEEGPASSNIDNFGQKIDEQLESVNLMITDPAEWERQAMSVKSQSVE